MESSARRFVGSFSHSTCFYVAVSPMGSFVLDRGPLYLSHSPFPCFRSGCVVLWNSMTKINIIRVIRSLLLDFIVGCPPRSLIKKAESETAFFTMTSPVISQIKFSPASGGTATSGCALGLEFGFFISLPAVAHSHLRYFL